VTRGFERRLPGVHSYVMNCRLWPVVAGGSSIPGIDPNLPVVNVGFAAPTAQELLLRVAYLIR
jgi:hypothetical protein